MKSLGQRPTGEKPLEIQIKFWQNSSFLLACDNNFFRGGGLKTWKQALVEANETMIGGTTLTAENTFLGR